MTKKDRKFRGGGVKKSSLKKQFKLADYVGKACSLCQKHKSVRFLCYKKDTGY